MKPKKLKELLVFAIVHKAPALTVSKMDQLSGGLMKLNTEELEILDDIVTELNDQNKTAVRRKAIEDGAKEESA